MLPITPIYRHVTNACRYSFSLLYKRSTSNLPVTAKNQINSDDGNPKSSQEIRKFLTDNDLHFTDGYTCYITTCPRQSRARLRLGEIDQLYVNMKSGYFVCHSCRKCGPWSSLKDNIQHLLSLASAKKRLPGECLKGQLLDNDTMEESEAVKVFWQSCKDVTEVETEILHNILKQLGIEVITLETLAKFGVRVVPQLNGLALPMYHLDKHLQGVKVIAVQVYKVGESERKRIITKCMPKSEPVGLFGMNLIKSSDKEVVITGSEFDTLVIHQETGKPCLALPRGTTLLPQKVLPLVEQFTRLILWLGHGHQQSWETASCFSRKLNESRCFLIRMNVNCSNALAALQQKENLSEILQTARPVIHQSIVTFQNLRKDVYEQLTHSEKMAGVKWHHYPILNNLLKGHRRGELTVFTGPTGSGKTTFISDYSLDLCQQGVNTLWGSFEINNVRLLKTMLTQFARCNMVKNINQFDKFADHFEQLPMYFMTFHGQENIRRVIETMSHAAYVYDIAHVIVDNLQFMLGCEGDKLLGDKFMRQDQTISAFRKFATTMNCHVTLVIHPRKEKEDELSMSSIFGTAKASQEADNVLILQDKRLTSLRGKKYIQVAKNRFDGELGIMLLKFNKETLSFAVTEKDSASKAKDLNTS